MIERPPGIASKPFREILLPALKSDLPAALSGLYWMATRRRVRGWSKLMIAASSSPQHYARWIAGGEIRAFAKFRDMHRPGSAPRRVVSLIYDEDNKGQRSALSRESIRGAFGEIPIYGQAEANSLADMLALLKERHPEAWLLAVRAGDRFSSQLADVISRVPANGLLYWDEDRIEQGRRSDPWIKPDWDPILFGNGAGLAGASTFPIAAVDQIACAIADRPIDADAIRELLSAMTKVDRPQHIPLILTHRGGGFIAREIEPSVPCEPIKWPSVSIIIPTRDRPELLAACLKGVCASNYPGQLETIIVDNGSRDPDALCLLRKAARKPGTVLLRDDGEFNFSRLNNRASAVATGDYLCLLNNDVEPLDSEWLSTLVRYALIEDVGAVGAQLLYPSGEVQHAGVAIGLGGAAGHVQKGAEPSDERYRTWHSVTREVSAVTAAVMVLSKKKFLDVGGFDEQVFGVAFNDVDLCLRLKQRGLRNIYVAEAQLMHRESESRGSDQSAQHSDRFAAELGALKRRWQTQGYSDPHFSPLFSPLVQRCVLVP